MDASEKIKGFHDKLSLWKRRLEVENYSNFSMFEKLLLQKEEIRKPLPNDLCLYEHLVAVQNSFKGYCLAIVDLKNTAWIRYPFLVEMGSVCGEDLAEDKLIELRAMESLQISFFQKLPAFADFWISLSEAYPFLVK